MHDLVFMLALKAPLETQIVMFKWLPSPERFNFGRSNNVCTIYRLSTTSKEMTEPLYQRQSSSLWPSAERSQMQGHLRKTSSFFIQFWCQPTQMGLWTWRGASGCIWPWLHLHSTQSKSLLDAFPILTGRPLLLFGSSPKYTAPFLLFVFDHLFCLLYLNV